MVVGTIEDGDEAEVAAAAAATAADCWFCAAEADMAAARLCGYIEAAAIECSPDENMPAAAAAAG